MTFKDLGAGSDRTVFGTYVYEDLELAFAPLQANKAFAADTVLHEVLHAIWRVGALVLEKQADEEKIVTVLATGFLQVLQANPKFVKWLQRQVA